MKKEKYKDSNGKELTKTTWIYGGILYENKQDQLHRLDGPAVIWKNGYQAWCLDGKFHREDGPARIWPDGKEEYYLEGVQVSKKEIDLIWLKKQVGK